MTFWPPRDPRKPSPHRPSLVEPEFRSRRALVRWRVKHLTLFALDQQTRRDAAADPAIEWDSKTRQYRLKRRKRRAERVGEALQEFPSAEPGLTAPAPPEATERSDCDVTGGQKVPDPATARPAAARNATANTIFRPGCGGDHVA